MARTGQDPTEIKWSGEETGAKPQKNMDIRTGKVEVMKLRVLMMARAIAVLSMPCFIALSFVMVLCCTYLPRATMKLMDKPMSINPSKNNDNSFVSKSGDCRRTKQKPISPVTKYVL